VVGFSYLFDAISIAQKATRESANS